MELFSSHFSHINEVINKNLDDKEPEFIQILDFLELLGDFEQTEINNILNYLEFNNFLENIAIYSKDKFYQKIDNPSEVLSKIFKEIRANNLTYSKVMGFNFEFRQNYLKYYFCLFDLFQINALKQISFKQKFACDKAIGNGYAYISNGSIGNLFKYNDLVIGFSKTRLNELLESEHISKIEIEPIELNQYEQLDEKHKTIYRYIHNFMESQAIACTYNDNELKVDDFLTVDNSELVQQLQAENEKLKQQLKAEHDKRIDDNIANTAEISFYSKKHYDELSILNAELQTFKDKCFDLEKQITKNGFFNWQSMDKHHYPPELDLAIQVWHGLNTYNFSNSHSDFSTRFNIIAKQLGIPQGKLFERIKTTVTPLVSKTQSQTLINSLIEISTIPTEKLDD